MNPFRKLWDEVVSLRRNLADGLANKYEQFVLSTKEFENERQVHGFYRIVSGDGRREIGFGFYCPVRGGGDSTWSYYRSGKTFMRHCGKTEVFDAAAPLPVVRRKPR